ERSVGAARLGVRLAQQLVRLRAIRIALDPRPERAERLIEVDGGLGRVEPREPLLEARIPGVDLQRRLAHGDRLIATRELLLVDLRELREHVEQIAAIVRGGEPLRARLQDVLDALVVADATPE